MPAFKPIRSANLYTQNLLLRENKSGYNNSNTDIIYGAVTAKLIWISN